jgi:hypothetical protein
VLSILQYRFLDQKQTRLFRTTDSHLDALIEEANTSNLKSAPAYYALSYCWGEDKRVKPISLNDTVLYETANLDGAIRQ